MHPAIVRRAIAAVAAITLLTIPSAFAETVDADGDLLTAGPQNSFDLGTVQPGADVPFDLFFVLSCSGTSHIDAGQNVRLNLGPRVVPPGGSFSVGSLLFGRGAGWPVDGQECPAGIQPSIGGPLHIIITAPMEPGLDYRYMFSWTRSLTNPNASDPTVFEGLNPSVEFFLDVPGGGQVNTPPTLHLPADSTVEGNTTGGALAAYTATASDEEDAAAPTPSCSPAVGAHLNLGTNTISCTATDTGGLEASGSFVITVQDTTAPVMPNIADVEITTADPTGATFDFGVGSVFEVVDPAPVITCDPISGTKFPVGTTPVTCTARDASGNQSTMSFNVRVTLRHVTGATWDDPVGAAAGITVNGSRTIPVKVQLLLDGQPLTRGAGMLTVRACAGGPSLATEPLSVQSNARWMGHLSTDGLAAGCYRVVASVDGLAIGSFQLDVRGDSATAVVKPAKANAGPKK